MLRAYETAQQWPPGARIPVAKTWKLYVDGKFPRSESGRYLPLVRRGQLLANVSRASRKDFREAVVAARNGLAEAGLRRARTSAARSCIARPRCSRAGANSPSRS